MECSFYKHLENTGVALSDVSYEPLRIPYQSGKKPRNYIPDFLVSTGGGDRLYEVKPIRRQRGKIFALKMAAGYRYAAANGLVFSVVSEDDFPVMSVKDARVDPDIVIRPRRRAGRG